MPGEPAGADALVALARREHRAGRLAEAAVAYRRLLTLRPDIAGAHNDLGNVLLRQGKLDEAAGHYEQALALMPELFQAHNELGCVLQAQGKLDEAAACFERAIALRPDFAEARNNLGNVLKDQGKLAQAAAQFERAVALKPNLFQAQINLGAILHEQGKLQQAANCFEQALALRPDVAEAYHNLGNVLKDQGKLDRAAVLLQRAVALRPDLVQAHYNLGNVLRDQQKLDPAADSYRQALAINPHYAEAYNNLGGVLKDQGKLDEAAACYEQAVALRPDHAEAYYNRTDLKTFHTGDPDLATLEAIAANPSEMPPAKMLFIHFALGKALEDVGDHARAMEHLLKGNALKRSQVDYDEAYYEQDCRLIAEVFNSNLIARFAGAGDPSNVPIFVLGMPRSGSTLVEQILASHPQVYAAGELKNLDRVVHEVTDSTGRPISFSAWIDALDAASLRRMAHAYLTSLPQLPAGKTRITDKLPGNFFRVGLIHMILPNARIIHTVRDPVETCVSCFSRLFSDLPFSYDLAELGRYFRRYHELMAHWRSVLPAGAMLDVAYEDVVGDLDGQARRLIDYCGLPWDDRCLSFHETRRPVATASNVQVRRPLYRSSVARWRRYEAYLQPLLAELEGLRPSGKEETR
jgi:tetratricopeptide (TPR) repeat protein